MPYKSFENQPDNLDIGDLNVSLLQNSQNFVRSTNPEDSKMEEIQFNDDMILTSRVGKLHKSNSTSYRSNNISRNNESDTSLQLYNEKLAIHEKHFIFINDETEEEVVLRDFKIKVDFQRKVRINALIEDATKKNPNLSFMREEKLVLFIFDPEQNMFCHLPYDHDSENYISFDFLQHQSFIQIKYNRVQSTPGAPDTNNRSLSPTAIHRQREQDITDLFYRNLQQKQPLKREKERTIGFAIDNVQIWRSLMREGIVYENIHIKLNLNQAAQHLGIKRKTLDEYNKQIKEGQVLNFDFESQREQKIGVLRKFNKDNKDLYKRIISQNESSDFSEINEPINDINLNFSQSNQNLSHIEFDGPLMQDKQIQYDEDFALQDQLEQLSDNSFNNGNFQEPSFLNNDITEDNNQQFNMSQNFMAGDQIQQVPQQQQNMENYGNNQPFQEQMECEGFGFQEPNFEEQELILQSFNQSNQQWQ